MKYIFIVLLPLALVVVIFAPEGLALWLGSDFSHNSAPVARFLAVAVLINSMAHVPFTHLQSVGRPDLTAKFHLMELPVYLVALFFLATSLTGMPLLGAVAGMGGLALSMAHVGPLLLGALIGGLIA